LNSGAGPFEILEILGEGSFGTVCVARVAGDPLRRKVALKILKGAYATNKKILNRTRDEARLLSQLNHPNIVRVERLMHINGRPVVVMEYVQGVSLDQLVLRHKEGLPPSIGLEVVRHACLALHVAFTDAGDGGRPMKVIHRDIKPSNILLSVHGQVKVCDFGIAKGDFEGREAETQSVVMGSRPYMAPERLDGVSDSPAVDVYSAGMTLFELLTGRPMNLSINPVNHDQAMSRQLRFVKVPGMSPQALEDLRDLLRRMCAYDRDHRPGSLEAARDLEQLVYAIDPQHRMSLPDFAAKAVLPIFESRPRVAPEGALDVDGDDELLREVTGQLTRSESKASPKVRWQPIAFIGGLGLIVVVLAVAAVVKVVARPSSVAVVAPGRVEISFWLPSDAVAEVADQVVEAPGPVSVFPGVNMVQLRFESGRTMNCMFMAEAGQGVRYVVEGDRGALSIDDGPGKPCTEVNLPPG
jgi:serine/threonine protein kinase